MSDKPEKREVVYPEWMEVSGFKSLYEPTRVYLKPLTLLAGANSSGKSSFMQPMLLLKQTLEAQFDPGPLKLDGDHVRFTSLAQMLSRTGKGAADAFSIAFGPLPRSPVEKAAGVQTDTAPYPPVRLRFAVGAWRGEGARFAPNEVAVLHNGKWVAVERFTGDEIYWVAEALAGVTFEPSLEADVAWRMQPTYERKRFRVVTSLATDPKDTDLLGYPLFFTVDPAGEHAPWLSSVLHVPALRGNPERRYRELSVAGEGDLIRVEGHFAPYTASVLVRWQEREETGRLGMVRRGLKDLGLTWTVKARRVSSVELELKVARRRVRGGRRQDLVDIADAGFGISQVMPLLVAVAGARPGQMVYVEQPELHLHPRAQWRLGKWLAEHAARGVLLVVETHSSLLLRGIQWAVASGALPPSDVGLHWFSQEPDTGITRVALADLDERGAFGDWPVDFSDVEMEADQAWLNAAWGEGSP